MAHLFLQKGLKVEFCSKINSVNMAKRATKKELEQKKELARMYYMNGDIQKVIAEKVGVSEQTISSWVDKEGWAARRA